MNILQSTFDKHKRLLREHLNLTEQVSSNDVAKIQSAIDNNQFLKGNKVSEKDLISGKKFVLYVSDQSLGHIKARHSDETKPGSIINPSVDLRRSLESVLNTEPNEVANGRVKWLGADAGGEVGKMGVKLGSPEEVAKMQDYQMPDGKKETVKISQGEREATKLLSVVTSELTTLDDGRKALSLITMFPGDVKVGNVVVPMDRGEFAKHGLYFVVKGGAKLNEDYSGDQISKFFADLKRKLSTKGVDYNEFIEKLKAMSDDDRDLYANKAENMTNKQLDSDDLMSFKEDVSKTEGGNQSVYDYDDETANFMISVLVTWLHVKNEYQKKHSAARGDMDALSMLDEHPGISFDRFISNS